MTFADWKLKRTRSGTADTIKSLAEWSIKDPSLKFVSLAEDSFTFTQSKSVDDEDDFQNSDIVRLYLDNVQVFMGRVLKPECSGESNSESRVTLCAGPWWYADNACCTQDWTGGPSLVPILTQIGTFFVRVAGSAPSEIGPEIRTMVNRLIGLGAPWTLGTLDARGQPPPQLLRNVTFAEAIHACLEPVPDIVSWFDYSDGNDDAGHGPKPTFHLRDIDNLEELKLTIGTDRIQNLRIGRHDDDDVPYVLIQLAYKTPVNIIGADAQPEIFYRTDYADHVWPGNAVRGFGGVQVTFDKTDPMDDWNATEFARRVFEAFKGVLWRGSFSVQNQEVDLRLRPGIRLNLAGSRAEFETMNALVQEVTHDMTSGKTTVSFGPPFQFGPSDLTQRLINLRRIRPATNDNLRNRDNGYTAGFGEDDEENQEQTAGRIRIVAGVLSAGVNTPTGTILQLPRGTRTVT